jgi:hypothetical protein
MTINNKFERLWKKVGVAEFEVPLQNFPGGTE